MKYSFVIVSRKINNYLEESVGSILSIDRDDYDIFIYLDECEDLNYFNSCKVKINISSDLSVCYKRNLIIKDSDSEFYIFIDDDAFVAGNYLDILDNYYNKQNINFIAGPNITPEVDSVFQKASGIAYAIGYPERYFSVNDIYFLSFAPAVNMVLRRETFSNMGGFTWKFSFSEDMKFCLDYDVKYKKSIVYDKNLIVYHHRRKNLFSHIKQVSRYGFYGAILFSNNLWYFSGVKYLKNYLSSIFVFALIFLMIMSFVNNIFIVLLIAYLIVYFLYILYRVGVLYKYEKNRRVLFIGLFLGVINNLFYGINFLIGFVYGSFSKRIRN